MACKLGNCHGPGPGPWCFQVDLETSGPTALRRVDFAAYVSKDASLERMAARNQDMAGDPRPGNGMHWDLPL